MTQLVTIAVPRTGSSHLGNHLRAFRGLRVFGEVFNPNNCFSLKSGHFEHLAARWGVDLRPEISDPDTVAWVRSHPDEMFELFAHFAGERTSVVKLFPSHLDRTFVTDELLPRIDVVALLVVRCVIDSYASAAKARQTRRWRGADTTDMRVEGDADEFIGWAKHQQRWYLDCRDALERAGRPVNVLTYEGDIDGGSEDLLATIEEVLSANGIDPGTRKEMAWVTRRQDATTDHREKFSNWDEFGARLDEAGMLELATGYFIRPN